MKYHKNWAVASFDSWPEPAPDYEEERRSERLNDQLKYLGKPVQGRSLMRTTWEETHA